ncbi:MAG: phosphate signaling complex protein PhoU [Myxococcales bacterium]|nr:phosphate signaling complex protein PhoU [Myxococcales bacterium]
MTKRHTDRAYEQQLEELRAGLVRMAGRVEQMISDSLRALVEDDPKLAERTIESDHKVNRAEVDADELCLQILARRQPVASDLRFITLALKMVTDLERIGDLAVNICERARDLSGQAPVVPWDDIAHMARLSQGMVHDAIDAFVAADTKMAQDVLDTDDQVDELYARIFHDILNKMMQDGSAVERGVHQQSVAKWLERMADHACNLAEQVVFMVKGRDIRHLGKLDD